MTHHVADYLNVVGQLQPSPSSQTDRSHTGDITDVSLRDPLIKYRTPEYCCDSSNEKQDILSKKGKQRNKN